jgi:hypothetical protein
MGNALTTCARVAARVIGRSVTTTKAKRRKARPASERETFDGRKPFTTVLHPDVRALLEDEAEREHGTRRRANFVIEAIARELLPRSS